MQRGVEINKRECSCRDFLGNCIIINLQEVLPIPHQKVRSCTNYSGLAPLVDLGAGSIRRFVQWREIRSRNVEQPS